MGRSQEVSIQISVQKSIAYQPYEIQWGKCQILQLEGGNPGGTHNLVNERLERSLTERDLGILVNGK